MEHTCLITGYGCRYLWQLHSIRYQNMHGYMRAAHTHTHTHTHTHQNKHMVSYLEYYVHAPPPPPLHPSRKHTHTHTHKQTTPSRCINPLKATHSENQPHLRGALGPSGLAKMLALESVLTGGELRGLVMTESGLCSCWDRRLIISGPGCSLASGCSSSATSESLSSRLKTTLCASSSISALSCTESAMGGNCWQAVAVLEWYSLVSGAGVRPVIADNVPLN